MDVFSHLLWTLILFRGESPLWLWLVLGTLPDLLTWGPWSVPLVVRRKWERFDAERIPGWVWRLYGATHSLFTAGALWGATLLATGRAVNPFLAWPVHVFMDAPTHSRHFLPTPILWPVSSWKFPGIRWAQRWFMALNYGAILALMVYLFGVQGERPRWA